MPSERWRQVEALYQAALERDGSARDQFLNEHCTGDPALRDEVASLLRHDAAAHAFFDAPAPELIGATRSASLAPGTRIGAYRVLERIGAGGMGEVYQAVDTNLGRRVAIKILPDIFARDPQRQARFEREARTLASLNHSNIAIIHGLEKADGMAALVMELVEGPTLAERIASGPLLLGEAIAVAKQIAEALEAAHDKGIIHRDLKPANVKLRPDGTVKVLDFGLAKAIEPAGHDQDVRTMTAPAMTEAGVILGTAAYMSPEQALGKPTDQRADVWAFGCVLYEMLAGKRAFDGDEASEILSAVLTKEPDWSALPMTTPRAVTRLLRRCLQKERKQRTRDIGDIWLALEDASDDEASQTAGVAGVPLLTQKLGPFAGVIVIVAVAGLAAWWLWPAAEPRLVNRFEYDLPIEHVFRGLSQQVVVLSNDGRQLVYNAQDGLYLRPMGALEARRIPGSEPPLTNPFFSPDGKAVGYWDQTTSQLMRIALAGGPPIAICRAENPGGVTWSADDTIFFAQANGIYRVPASGGTAELVIPRGEGERFYRPQLLPDGDSVLFSVAGANGNPGEGSIAVQSLRSSARKVLQQGGSDARYVPPSHLVFARGDGLFVASLDVKRLALAPGLVPLIEGVSRPATGVVAHYSISNEGTLVYLPRRSFSASLVWVDRHGREDALNAPPQQYVMPRISPDGTEVAVTIPAAQADVWIWNLSRKTLRQLTFDPGVDIGALWSPDGQQIVYSSQEGGGPLNLFRRAADGSGVATRLTQSPNLQMPDAFSGDGSQLVFTEAAGSGDLNVVGLQGEHQVRSLLKTPASESRADVSPNGRWVAYESNESGQPEVYVQAFPDLTGGKFKVSSGGGTRPRWSRDGRELFYFVEPGRVMAVPVDTGKRFTFGNPVLVVDGPYLAPEAVGAYDVSPDGQRFLMLKPTTSSGTQAAGTKFVIIQNWQQELGRLAQ